MILLDTHVALWLLFAPERIGPQARHQIAGGDAVHFSPISIAEITIKGMLGRLDVPDDVAARLERSGIAPLPLTATHAEAIAAHDRLTRHDPFDRLLVAQAYAERGRLATADQRLLVLAPAVTMDAGR